MTDRDKNSLDAVKAIIDLLRTKQNARPGVLSARQDGEAGELDSAGFAATWRALNLGSRALVTNRFRAEAMAILDEHLDAVLPTLDAIAARLPADGSRESGVVSTHDLPGIAIIPEAPLETAGMAPPCAAIAITMLPAGHWLREVMAPEELYQCGKQKLLLLGPPIGPGQRKGLPRATYPLVAAIGLTKRFRASQRAREAEAEERLQQREKVLATQK
jgi:hypothetical protein